LKNDKLIGLKVGNNTLPGILNTCTKGQVQAHSIIKNQNRQTFDI